MILLSCLGVACAEDSRNPVDGGPSLTDTAVGADRHAPDVRRADAELTDAQSLDAAPSNDVADAQPLEEPVRINELMPSNDGAWVDEEGQTEDWIELHNRGDQPVGLAGYALGDRPDRRHDLPDTEIPPGGFLLLWADGEPNQGDHHLSFRLSAEGETVYLWSPSGTVVDSVAYGGQSEPPAEPNHSLVRLPDGDGDWARCPWATPARANGSSCGPPPPPEPDEGFEFSPYEWASPWPHPPTPLVMTELALRPARFVEVLNVAPTPTDLAAYEIRLSPHRPGAPWPARGDGVLLAWPETRELGPGERVVVPVAEADVATLAGDPAFEGVVTLWADGRNAPIERVDFMRWPDGAMLTRVPDADGMRRFCATATPQAPNEICDPLPSREVGERIRRLLTPGDFSALAAGGVATQTEAVKFVIDIEAGYTVHLLSTAQWDLHYTFVRERIDLQPPLDRCDAEESRLFSDGWRAFSRANYEEVEDRRFLLGTLVHHAGSGLRTLEFTPGDHIVGDQMRVAFFITAAHLQQPTSWQLRPQSDRQLAVMQQMDGQAPITETHAPFRGMTYQPLTRGVGYGVLTFLPVDALESTPLGPQVIVVTDQVPNDIALVGGLITEAFQTPLAHVNLLSRNRNTPNMALRDARDQAPIAEHIGQLVRLEVEPGGYEIRAVEPAEAEAFWESRRRSGPLIRPRTDTTVRGVTPLRFRGLEDLPALGAKAAQLAELGRLFIDDDRCPGPITSPGPPLRSRSSTPSSMPRPAAPPIACERSNQMTRFAPIHGFGPRVWPKCRG